MSESIICVCVCVCVYALTRMNDRMLHIRSPWRDLRKGGIFTLFSLTKFGPESAGQRVTWPDRPACI